VKVEWRDESGTTVPRLSMRVPRRPDRPRRARA